MPVRLLLSGQSKPIFVIAFRGSRKEKKETKYMCVCKEVGKKIEPLPSFSSRGQRHFKGVWQSYRQQEVVILNCLISQGFIDLICGAVAFLLHARYSRISFIQLHTRFSTVAFVLE